MSTTECVESHDDLGCEAHCVGDDEEASTVTPHDSNVTLGRTERRGCRTLCVVWETKWSALWVKTCGQHAGGFDLDELVAERHAL